MTTPWQREFDLASSLCAVGVSSKAAESSWNIEYLYETVAASEKIPPIGREANVNQPTSRSVHCCTSRPAYQALSCEVGILMEAFEVRLLNGVTAILVADVKPLYLNTGTGSYTVEDLIDGKTPYLQEGHGESVRPVIEWNNAVAMAVVKRMGTV